MTDNATAVNMLDIAADIVKAGWAQRVCTDEKRCIAVAISDAWKQLFGDSKDKWNWSDAHKAVEKYLEETDPGFSSGCINLFNWNDTPGRTQQEVVDTLRAVARKLEAEG